MAETQLCNKHAHIRCEAAAIASLHPGIWKSNRARSADAGIRSRHKAWRQRARDSQAGQSIGEGESTSYGLVHYVYDATYLSNLYVYKSHIYDIAPFAIQ